MGYYIYAIHLNGSETLESRKQIRHVNTPLQPTIPGEMQKGSSHPFLLKYTLLKTRIHFATAAVCVCV